MNAARIRYLCMAASLTVWASPSAHADDETPPPSGLFIRVTAPTISQTPLAGRLIASNDHELTVFTLDASTVTLPRDAVTRVEWSGGQRSRAGTFARRGAIAIGSVGAIVGALAYKDNAGERLVWTGIGGAAGALHGALAGAMIGIFKHSYEWKEGPLPGVQASVSPGVSSSSAGITVVLRW